jgi:excisionase family DNA binding protein
MSNRDTEPVTIGVISAEFGIPRQTLYSMVASGRLPAVDVTKDWSLRRQYRFRRADVKALIEQAKRERSQRPARSA